MIDIKTVLSSLPLAVDTIETIVELVQKRKGDERLLLEEMKENLRLCRLVVEQGTAPMKIVPRLSTLEYDRILGTPFNFNRLKKGKIRSTKKLASSDLSSFIGKRTADLIVNIYDRVKDLKTTYDVDRYNASIQWYRRIVNLRRRILLLMWHLDRK